MIVHISATGRSNLATTPSTAIGQDTISAGNAKANRLSAQVQPADWMTGRAITDRRERHRSRAAFPVSVTPLDISLKPTADGQSGALLNYSNEGACLEHTTIIAEPYIHMVWEDSVGKKHTAVLRLKWCRSIGENVFLSGGKVVGMD